MGKVKFSSWCRTLAGSALVGLLASCGGGGGAGGVGPYSISITANTTSLPLNIAQERPAVGGRYTATLYVNARDNAGRPIPDSGDEEVFGCNVENGLDSGALYYLDGKEEHTTTTTVNGVEVKYPSAYRNIALHSNSGGNSFHLLASDVVGAVTVRCSVSEPSTKIQRSAQITIQVGGAPSGKASQVLIDKVDPNYPGYFFVQGVNTYNQVPLQASVVDEAGQPVSNPATGNNNVQVRIVPSTTTTADDNALLRGANANGLGASGQSIHIQTVNGQAPFTLVSGNSPGTVTVEVVADRSDNNVGNGITDPVYNYASFSIVTSSPGSGSTSALQITTTSLPAATGNITYGALLEATGGTAPYTWSMVSTSLPTGLSMGSSGVIYGTPYGTTSGTFTFVVQVTDARGATKQQTMSIAYTAPAATPVTPPDPLVVTPTSGSGAVGGNLSFVVTGGTPGYVAISNNDAVATIPGSVQYTGAVYRFSVSLIAAGTTQIAVTDQSGQAVVVNVTVTGGTAGVTDLTITPSVGGSIAIGQSQRFMVSGGVPPYEILSTNTAIGTVTTPVTTTGGTFTFMPVTAGAVTLIIRDSTGALKTTSITVTQPGGTVLAAMPTSASWSGGCSTTLSATDFVVYGGIPPYTAFSTITSIATVTGPFTNASNYTYFTVREACTGATGQATIVFRDSVNATFSVTYTYTP